MGKVPVSVAVIVKNEERNITDCLKSAEWADEIVVVDDESSDKTVELARQFTDKIFKRKMDIEGLHRNYAYSVCSNEWVLSLDADERVTPELAAEIGEIIKKEKDSPEHAAYGIPIKTYIGKRWAKYAGWYPAPKIRLFKKGKFKYDEISKVHPRVFIEGTNGFLKGDIIHYAYKGLDDFLRNTNEQTTLQAIEWHKQGKKFSFFKLFRTTIDRFVRKYFFKGGIKGGFLGFMLSFADGMYQYYSYAKLWELYTADEEKG